MTSAAATTCSRPTARATEPLRGGCSASPVRSPRPVLTQRRPERTPAGRGACPGPPRPRHRRRDHGGPVTPTWRDDLLTEDGGQDFALHLDLEAFGERLGPDRRAAGGGGRVLPPRRQRPVPGRRTDGDRLLLDHVAVTGKPLLFYTYDLAPLPGAQHPAQQIENLRRAFGDEVPLTAVVGFRAEVVMAAADDLTFVYNPDLLRTGQLVPAVRSWSSRTSRATPCNAASVRAHAGQGGSQGRRSAV